MRNKIFYSKTFEKRKKLCNNKENKCWKSSFENFLYQISSKSFPRSKISIPPSIFHPCYFEFCKLHFYWLLIWLHVFPILSLNPISNKICSTYSSVLFLICETSIYSKNCKNCYDTAAAKSPKTEKLNCLTLSLSNQ